jgi:hypothetical protein
MERFQLPLSVPQTYQKITSLAQKGPYGPGSESVVNPSTVYRLPSTGCSGRTSKLKACEAKARPTAQTGRALPLALCFGDLTFSNMFPQQGKMRKDLLFMLLGAVAVTLHVAYIVVDRTRQHSAGNSRPAAVLEAVVPGLGMGGVLRQQSLAEVNEPVSLSYDEKQGSCRLLGQKNAEYLDRQNVSCLDKFVVG